MYVCMHVQCIHAASYTTYTTSMFKMSLHMKFRSNKLKGTVKMVPMLNRYTVTTYGGVVVKLH